MNIENVALLTKEMRNTDLVRCDRRLALESQGEIVEACIGGLAVMISGVAEFRKVKALRLSKGKVYNVMGAYLGEDGLVKGSIVPPEVWDWLGGNTLDAPTYIVWDDEDGYCFPLRDRLDSLNDTSDLSWDQLADLIEHFGLVHEEYEFDYYEA